MKLENVQQTINKRETVIQTVVLDGFNQWLKENNQEPVQELPDYAPPLIRYAIEDWLDEYTFKKDLHPDQTFAQFIHEQESNLMFHFKQSLTHKAETTYRGAHAVLWRGLTTNGQTALIAGLRHLIRQSQ